MAQRSGFGESTIRWCGLAVVLIMYALVSACGSVDRRGVGAGEPQPSLDAPSAAPMVDAESRTLDEGLQEFQKGDYQKAMATIEYLSEHAEREEVRRKSVYALAGTRLALAQTPEEFGEAMNLWNCWLQYSSGNIKDEDPKMITPFLRRLSLPSMSELGPGGQKAAKPRKKPVTKLELVSKDLEAYKNLLDVKEKENQRIKARLESREREVRKLKQQIESLEEIHLKYQERKNEVSSP